MEPAKSLRKRRRWLIVALLFVLVSGVAWWEWPRGDARFVGRWRAARNTFDIESMDFGRAEVGIRNSETGLLTEYRWRTTGDVLNMETRASSLPLPTAITDWFYIETGWLLSHSFQPCRFQFSPDGSSVHLKGDDLEIDLERIPE